MAGRTSDWGEELERWLNPIEQFFAKLKVILGRRPHGPSRTSGQSFALASSASRDESVPHIWPTQDMVNLIVKCSSDRDRAVGPAGRRTEISRKDHS